ncbi:MAG: hypothetical protein WC378_01835 [Opitutaceae bacterium]|jgi:hypothetical protein
MGSPLLVTYSYQFQNGDSWSHSVDVNRARNASATVPASAPEWARLGFHRCENCPLSEDRCSHCPPAVDSAPILERFASIPSIAPVRVTVTTSERTCIRETDAQLGLKALLGVVMATSACPILVQLRSQALFHLPFASVDETLYRAVGDYLIKQYFAMKDGKQPDFDLAGLDRLYRDLATLNIAFFNRIQASSPNDANVNAIVTFRSMSDIVSMSLDDRLSPLREAMQELGA